MQRNSRHILLLLRCQGVTSFRRSRSEIQTHEYHFLLLWPWVIVKQYLPLLSCRGHKYIQSCGLSTQGAPLHHTYRYNPRVYVELQHTIMRQLIPTLSMHQAYKMFAEPCENSGLIYQKSSAYFHNWSAHKVYLSSR